MVIEELRGRILKEYRVSRVQEVVVQARDEQEAREIGADMIRCGEGDGLDYDIECIDT